LVRTQKTTLQKSITSPKIKFIPYLSWNLEVKNHFKSLGFNNVYITGAPFLYLSKIIKLEKNKKNKKILFFPPHNTIDLDIHNLKNKDLCEKLSKKYKKKILRFVYIILILKTKK
jgi:hypothetical protein